MASWSDILGELTQSGSPPNFDEVRRRYAAALHRHTGRNVIVYTSGWLQKPDVLHADISISDADMLGMMEVNYGLSGDQLDLILHSPGGSAEAAESLVAYLRARFMHIRVFVPHLAMSAATMIACAADEIVLGRHSFLGPTDPQIMVPDQAGIRLVPAQNVLDQFEKAQKEAHDPAKLAAWLPMLAQYGPDLLVTCEASLKMSRGLVARWLETWMLRNRQDAAVRAGEISEWLANHTHFNSHARHIGLDALKEKGMCVARLEDDPKLQDLVLSVFHATIHSLSMTPATKIIENHVGHAYIVQLQPPPSAAPFGIQIGISPPENPEPEVH